MAHSTDIVAYIYQADIYCPDCTAKAWHPVSSIAGTYSGPSCEMVLDRVAKFAGIDRMDEFSFDSDEFPKVVFRDQTEDGERCGRCGRNLND